MENKGECEEWDGNADAENQSGNAGNLSGNTKNVRNQGGDAENQGGNLSIAVEISRDSNGMINSKIGEKSE